MTYKEQQQVAKKALRASTLRWEVGTANLGIKQYKRDHPHLRGNLIQAEKARRWDTIKQGTTT